MHALPAPLTLTKDAKKMFYKTAQVTWCHSYVIVAVFGFEHLYYSVFAQKLVGPQKAPHWVRASPASKGVIFTTIERD